GRPSPAAGGTGPGVRAGRQGSERAERSAPAGASFRCAVPAARAEARRMTLDWPTLVTERLILRPWKPEDFAPYARFSADEEAMRYLGRDGRPTDAAETGRASCHFIGHRYLRGYTPWAAAERS